MRPARAAILGLVLVTAGCAAHFHRASGTPMVVERLYFGRNEGEQLAVSDSSWAVFLSDVVTPRFPEGLTAWRAEGQWRGADGVVRKEPSFVLELVHPARAGDDRAVGEIIGEYKRRFHQESVLRVRSEGEAGY